MKIKHFATVIAMTASLVAMGQNGTITGEMLEQMRQQYQPTGAERALRNALNTSDINTLAANPDAKPAEDGFTYRVPTKGINDQESSGRCWLFTGINMLRAQAISRGVVKELNLSAAYNFFYDQLEKANLFLQCVIDTRKESMSDRKVEWLFRNPLADGGQFTGISDNVSKYGVVPASVMPETYVTNHTSTYRRLLGWKLKEWGLALRKASDEGASVDKLQTMKKEMLSQVYSALCRQMGTPPTEFTWKGKKYTPQSFYNEIFGNDLKNDYVMFMNDPTRPYYKLYEIDLDRHMYDGRNWTYLNVPMEDIKEMAIASLKDSTAMYFSCDVSKFINRKSGTLDLDNYNYGDLLGMEFNMTKAERIQTGASASSHAMTLVGVNIDDKGASDKWLIENSWGAKSGFNGHLVATDEWMDEYLFRLVVERKYVPKKLLDKLTQKAELLPCWDPMF